MLCIIRMKKGKNIVLLIIGIVLIALSSSKVIKTPSLIRSFDTQTIKQIDSIGDAFIKSEKALGFSIVVMHRKDVLYAKGFGFQDLNKSKPFTPETTFQIASVSKFITSIAVIKLAEKGKLSLDTKLSDIFPSYPLTSYADKIEIRHLLQRTSGIREYIFISDS